MTRPTLLPEHCRADSQPLGANAQGKYDSFDLKQCSHHGYIPCLTFFWVNNYHAPYTNAIKHVFTSRKAEVVSNQMVSRLRHGRGAQIDCQARSSDCTLCLPGRFFLTRHAIGMNTDQWLQAYWVKYIDQANISKSTVGVTNHSISNLMQIMHTLPGSKRTWASKAMNS
jgi:hypothetical protein